MNAKCMNEIANNSSQNTESNKNIYCLQEVFNFESIL